MKNLIFVFFLILNALTLGENKIAVIDEDYIVNNYDKTIVFNEELGKLKTNIEKKYNLDFEKDKEALSAKEDYIKFEELKEKRTLEIKDDISFSTFLMNNGNLLLAKDKVLYGETHDITEDVLNFLDDIYSSRKRLEEKAIKLEKNFIGV